MEDNGVACGSESGIRIQFGLPSKFGQGFGSAHPILQGNALVHSHNQTHTGSAKRDFLKVLRLVSDQDCGLYEEPIIASVH